MRAVGFEETAWDRVPALPATRSFVATHLDMTFRSRLEALGAVGPGHEWAIPRMFPYLVQGIDPKDLREALKAAAGSLNRRIRFPFPGDEGAVSFYLAEARGRRRGSSKAGRVALLLIGILVTGAEAQVYHWVDDQGVIHYTTGIESVPERYRPAARALPVSTADPPSESPAASRSGTSTISFTSGAPILVSARINGSGPVTLILDTGAERTVVTPAALAQLGIPTPNTHRAVIRGVTGSSVADVVWVASLEVGGARAGPLAIIAHDAGLPQADGLLGRDFLSLFSVTIDVRASVVTLEPN